MNPARNSLIRSPQKDLASLNLTEFVASVAPDIVMKNLDEWTPDLDYLEAQHLIAATSNVHREKRERGKPALSNIGNSRSDTEQGNR